MIYNFAPSFPRTMDKFNSTLSALLFMYLLVLITGSDLEISNLTPEPYRFDYTYSKDLNIFYKIHSIAKTWNSARATCAAEGATLMWFNTQNEFQYFLNADLKKTIFLGIHSKFSKDKFVTMKGTPIEHVYTKWANEQPNNVADNVDCGVILWTGVMSVYDCDMRLPFICRRDFDGNQSYLNNECRSYDTGYSFEKSLQRCYKVHAEPKNWTDAFALCSSAGAYLAVINSEKESEYLVHLTKRFPVYGTYWPDKNQFLLGFHDIFAEGEYRTIFGETLNEAGYDRWDAGQPNNIGGAQHCGALMQKSTGHLNDVWCTKPFPFICELEILA